MINVFASQRKMSLPELIKSSHRVFHLCLTRSCIIIILKGCWLKSRISFRKKGTLLKSDMPAHLRIQISNEYSIFQSMKSSNKLKDPLYENKKRYPNVNDQFSVLNANSKWQECAQKVAWMISQSLLEIDGRMMVLKKHWS